MAIAHEAQVELSLDDFDRISREIPYLCNLKPSGEYPMELSMKQEGYKRC